MYLHVREPVLINPVRIPKLEIGISSRFKSSLNISASVLELLFSKLGYIIDYTKGQEGTVSPD